MRGTEKKREKLNASRHFIDDQKDFWLQCSWSLDTAPNQARLQKKSKSKVITRVKMGRNKKCNKKSQKATSRRKVNSGLQDEQWHKKEISQPAKISLLPFFLYFLLLFHCIFCSSFLLVSDLQTEFDSNSSCLDRLNNFGIYSLQKLQNLPRSVE